MGLYYLQSRYYNPTIGRFLNADTLVSTGQGVLGNNMFAYCLNNPVNRIDVSGSTSLWYYLIVDSDMGLIHRAVVEHIHITNPGVTTEKRLGNWGRADIVQDGAVWEVKHAGKNPSERITVAWAQAMTYLTFSNELSSLGAAGAFSGAFYINCLASSYLVEYSTPKDGVILYSITEIYDYDGEYYLEYIPKKQKKEKLYHSFFAEPYVLFIIGVGGGGGGVLPDLTNQKPHTSKIYLCG